MPVSLGFARVFIIHKSAKKELWGTICPVLSTHLNRDASLFREAGYSIQLLRELAGS